MPPSSMRRPVHAPPGLGATELAPRIVRFTDQPIARAQRRGGQARRTQAERIAGGGVMCVLRMMAYQRAGRVTAILAGARWSTRLSP